MYTGTLVLGRSNNNQAPVKRENIHPSIVTTAAFNKVQSFVRQRSPKNCKPRSLVSQYLLSGLIYCGKCCYALQGCSAKSGRFHYYACHNAIRKGKKVCDAKLVNKDRIEAAVILRLKDHVLTDGNLSELLDLTNREL